MKMIPMSLVKRQHTCALCGHDLIGDFHIETLVDHVIRFIAVCTDCSTFCKREVADVKSE